MCDASDLVSFPIGIQLRIVDFLKSWQIRHQLNAKPCEGPCADKLAERYFESVQAKLGLNFMSCLRYGSSRQSKLFQRLERVRPKFVKQW